jgi:hypothetical protein
MGHGATRISADLSRVRFAENRLKPTSTYLSRVQFAVYETEGHRSGACGTRRETGSYRGFVAIGAHPIDDVSRSGRSAAAQNYRPGIARRSISEPLVRVFSRTTFAQESKEGGQCRAAQTLVARCQRGSGPISQDLAGRWKARFVRRPYGEQILRDALGRPAPRCACLGTI